MLAASYSVYSQVDPTLLFHPDSGEANMTDSVPLCVFLFQVCFYCIWQCFGDHCHADK